jgi:glycine oxidase
VVEHDADVLIVGAGIIGCAAGRELALQGASVEIVDPRGEGMGATQASAGVLAPYIEAHEGGTLLDLTARSLALYDPWIDRIRSESDVSIEYQRTGSLEVALDASGAQRLRDLAARYGSRERMEWLEGAGARDAEPALPPGVQGALSIPAHGYVAAPSLTAALAASGRALGVRFRHGARVTRVQPRADRVEVTIADGVTRRVGTVVIAAGSWSGQVQGLPDAAPGDVRPVRGQILRVAWRGRPLSPVVWGPACYIVSWLDGTTLVGATMEEAGFEERNTAAGVRTLLDAARALLPGIEDATFREARSGLRPATSDGLPIIGRSEFSDRIVYATGHYRNGILLAPLTAQLVAGLVNGDEPDPILKAIGPGRIGAVHTGAERPGRGSSC